MVERADVPVLAPTVLTLHLERATGGARLVAAVAVRLTDPDRTVRTHPRGGGAVAGELLGDLAEGITRRFRKLATDSLALVSQPS